MPVAQLVTTVGRSTGPHVSWGSIVYTAVNEGQQNTVYLDLSNWDNSDIYWYLVDAGNTAISNSTQVTPNAGVLYTPGTGSWFQSFNFTFNNDATTDGTLTYYIRIENEAGDLLMPRQGPFTCNDTSFAIEGQYVFNGTPTTWATTLAPTGSTYGAYTYPDGTSGSLHTLTGTQYLLSGSLGKSPTVNINLWFYPTANNKLIMGEVGQSQENTGWHYSMLEIDSTNHLKGRIWEMSSGPFPTSVGTVTLNAWNHVHLYFNNSTSTFGMSLNNETAVTQSSVGRHVPDGGYVGAYYGIGMFETQFMAAQDRYEGKFDTPAIDTTLTGSNYSSTKAKYLPPSSLVFNQPQGDYLSTPGNADWNLGTTWTIEFWLNANSSGYSGNPRMTGDIWGLLNQGGWGTSNSINIAISDAKLVVGQGGVYADVRYTEPTPSRWTHVAISNNAGTQRVFYNGAEQTKVSGSFNTANYANSTDSLAIGNMGVGNNKFDGKMALVRISYTAKYSTAFTPTITYGVDAGSSLAIPTNSDGGLGGWGSTSLSIAYDPTIISTYPVGSTITFQDNTTATITGWDPYGPSYIDLFWDTPKSGTLFPLTLTNTGDTLLFLGTDTPLVDSMSHSITNNGVTTSIDLPTPLSLNFVQSQTDYLDVAASSDWAMSSTWTIEFWSKAAKASTAGDLLTVMCQDYTDGNSIQILYQNGFQIQGGPTLATEPTPNVWTHVALVSDGTNLKLYYNGVSQYTGGYWSLANNTNPIRIGARGTATFHRFDGQLALIRISNTAKYSATFTPTTTYGVEGDTKLFLGKYDPLVDTKGHAVTNNGVTTSTSFPT